MAAAIITGLADRDVRYQPLTDELLEAGMTRAGLPAEAVAMVLGIGGAARAGYLGRITDMVQRYIGRPLVSVAESLARHRSARPALPQSG